MNDPHLLLAAYALDALDADDRAVFEEHLTDCEDCRRELAEFGPTVAELSALSETDPPADLRQDVLTAIGRVRQDDPGPQSDPAEPSQQTDEVAVQRATRGRRLAGRITAAVTAAAVIAALALGGWAYTRSQLIQDQRAHDAAVSRVIGAPDARIYLQEAPNGMRVNYVVSASRNSAVAVPENVADPGEHRVYQLWTVQVRDDEQIFVPDRTFDTAGGPILLTGEVATAAALGVTVEPDGGSPQPTSDPFAVQTL